jgi:hypothetical protein
MKKHLILAGMVALMAACAHEGNSPSSMSDWGTGLNSIERSYNKPAPDTFSAAVSALKSFSLTIDKDVHDEFGGELEAHRADGSKVSVNVVVIDKAHSEAVVRVGPGNSAVATMIHEVIADKLGMGKANAAFLGGNTEEFPYASDVKAGAEAAERTFKALGWSLLTKDLKEASAQIDARAEDSHPASIKLVHSKDPVFTLKVKFTAGNGNTDMSKTMIGRMHDEFDRQIGGHVR